MNTIDLSRLAEVVDATRAIRWSAAPLPLSAIGAQGWSLFGGDMPLPLAVIRDSALAHNHVWMRDFNVATGAEARAARQDDDGAADDFAQQPPPAPGDDGGQRAAARRLRPSPACAAS